MDGNGLPAPDSDELRALVTNQVGRRIYGELHAAPDGLDIYELKQRIPEFADQMHFDRRLRDLDKPFLLERQRVGNRLVYRLAGRRDRPQDRGRISKRRRAEVLFRDGSRCQMCGRNPERDVDVVLHVDHKVPLAWGGENEIDNLWTLCRECNEGKRDFFASADEHADEMRAAIRHDEVHRRLGELLRAFGPGIEVPSYMLSIAASAKQFQEDWHRRLRELRELGWDYEVRKRKEGGRITSYYVLTRDGGFPSDGTVREALRSGGRR